MSVLGLVEAARREVSDDITEDQISVHALSASIGNLVLAYRIIQDVPTRVSNRESVILSLYHLGFEVLE